MALDADREKLTYAEFVQYPNDGQRHEVVDGDHYMNPAPSTNHQAVSGRLLVQLFAQIDAIGRGQVFHAPTDVELGPHDIVEPDLVVVLAGNEIIEPSRIRGVPDLVAEILSPSTADYDRGPKRLAYERAGVPEFWLVDLETHRVEVERCGSAGFEHVGCFSERFTFGGIDDVTIDLTRVW